MISRRNLKYPAIHGGDSLLQLNAIIEQLPTIEQSLGIVMQKGLLKIENVESICLYDYDIENAMYARITNNTIS
jgi:hypothetical protein